LIGIEDIGIEEYLYGKGVTVIEWAGKMERLLPKKRISVKFSIKGENKRGIDIVNISD